VVTDEPLSLTVLILALNEGENLRKLLPQLKTHVERVSNDFEIVIVDGGSTDDTLSVATSLGCRVVRQSRPGYGQALREGIAACSRPFILTLDADMSHPPSYLEEMVTLIRDHDIVIASRYTSGGGYEMPRHRMLLSRALNFTSRLLFGLSVADTSSGYRLYRSEVIQRLPLEASQFDVLIELLVKVKRAGGRFAEVPFQYRNREDGVSKARLLSFGVAYLRTLLHLRTRL
jgi:dolichol-phosphate mannosyltransferase